MSLDNFQLPPHLLSELYKNSLVVLDDKQINTKSLKEENLVFLGDNEKNILILVEDEKALHINDDDLGFLTGILSACKLTLADIALLNMIRKKNNQLIKVIEDCKPLVLINFNVKINELGLDQNKYQVIKKDNIQILSAGSLNQISNNIEEKKKLWGCLKTIFSV